jgi:hypothetical protein
MITVHDIFPVKIFDANINVSDEIVNTVLKLGREKNNPSPDNWEGGCQSSHDSEDNEFIKHSEIPEQVINAVQEVAKFNNVMKDLGNEFRYNYVNWWNYYNKGEYQEYHQHGNYTYSAILYLTESNSDTVFCHNGMTHHVKSEKNKLVIFPSWLAHYVQPCEEDERASIAFNFNLHH